MKQDMRKQREKMTMQSIDMRQHREALRRSLLTSSHWEKKQMSIFDFLKGGEKIMKKNAFVTAGIAFALIALITVAVTVFVPKGTQQAYAEELAQKSFQAVATLTPDQEEALKHKVMVDNPKELLEKAKNAKDLKTLTYEQFARQNPLPPGGTSHDLRTLNFLQFTDTDGSIVILGVDPTTNLPTIIMVSKGNPGDSSKKGAEKNVMFKSSGEGDKGGASFGSSDGHTKVEGVFKADGQGTILVDGKKYKMPAGVKISPDSPPSIKVEGNEVYINGIKATPAE